MAANSPNNSEPWVTVGEIAGAHGIRGELKLDVRPGLVAKLAPGTTLALGPAFASAVQHEIVHARPATAGARAGRARLLLKVRALTDRDAAQALQGCSVWMPRPPQPERTGNEPWAEVVIGSRMETVDGELVGIVIDVEPGLQDRMVVQRVPGETFEVPLVEGIVRHVDREGGRVVVDLPQGLI